MGKELAKELITIVHESAPKLNKLSLDTVTQKPAPDQWAKIEILGHLVDSASNNRYRFVELQVTDSPVFRRYDQELWVSAQKYIEYDWKTLVNFWKMLNFHLSFMIARMPDYKLSMKVPDGNPLLFTEIDEPVTFRYLIEDYIVHMLYHLDRILS